MFFYVYQYDLEAVNWAELETNMANYASISQFIKEHPHLNSVEAIFCEYMRGWKTCPACEKLFECETTLRTHLAERHADNAEFQTRKGMPNEQINEETKEIWICAFCGFAEPDNLANSINSRIVNHIERCDEYRALPTTEHKRWRVSKDPDLISQYADGDIIIQSIECPTCKEDFGTIESLHWHLVKNHSHTSEQDIGDAQRQEIRAQIRDALEELEKRQKDNSDSFTPNEGHNKASSDPQKDLATSKTSDTSPRGESKVPVNARPRKTDHVNENPTQQHFEHTLLPKELDSGECRLPPHLQKILTGHQKIQIKFGSGQEACLPYDSRNGQISGLAPWYVGNALAAGDIIQFEVLDNSKPRIRVSATWQKNLEYLLTCPPLDFQWAKLSIRDCLVKVMAQSGEPTHFRTLYAEVSKHRDLAPSSIISTLSLYKGVLFEQAGQGKWMLARENLESLYQGRNEPISKSKNEIRDAVAEELMDTIVSDVIDKDIAYRILEKAKNEMSVNLIARVISNYYSIEQHNLPMNKLFNPMDTRFTRLHNGNFILSKYLTRGHSTSEVANKSDESSPQSRTQQVKKRTALVADEDGANSDPYYFHSFSKRVARFINTIKQVLAKLFGAQSNASI